MDQAWRSSLVPRNGGGASLSDDTENLQIVRMIIAIILVIVIVIIIIILVIDIVIIIVIKDVEAP